MSRNFGPWLAFKIVQIFAFIFEWIRCEFGYFCKVGLLKKSQGKSLKLYVWNKNCENRCTDIWIGNLYICTLKICTVNVSVTWELFIIFYAIKVGKNFLHSRYWLASDSVRSKYWDKTEKYSGRVCFSNVNT